MILAKLQKIVSEEWKRRADRLHGHVDACSSLREAVRVGSSFEDMVYHYYRDFSTTFEAFGRIFASMISLLKVTRSLRHATCETEAEDWDIKNCMFVLTVQPVQRMQINLKILEANLRAWTR